MGFHETFQQVATVLKKIGSTVEEENYDGLIVKRLEASNTLDKGRTTKQSHIAITGPQMDMFPYVRADGYFEVDYDDEDADLKKYFVAQIPIILHRENVEYLDAEAQIFPENEKMVHVSIVRSRRKDAADQIQMSMTYMDTPEYVEYRRIVHAGSYMVMLKKKSEMLYDMFSVKPEDAELEDCSLKSFNNSFEKVATNTVVRLNEYFKRVNDMAQDNTEEDEYSRAAKIIKDHITESGFEIPVTKEQIESAREEFVSRFNYKLLSSLSDEELLSRVFYTTGDNTEALCCWIEMNKDCKNYFGSISGGSAYKFGLFQKKETGMWTTGSPQKSQELTDEEAVQRGREIVNALVKGAEIIEKAELNSLADYEKLDDDLKAEVGEQFYNWAWFHKYYSIMFPEKLSNYHSTDWQCHVLRSLGIKPSEKYYARSGQISMIENRGGLLYREFGHVFFDKFGGIKSFVRMGTSDDEKSYVAEWKQRSVIGLGWKALGSLENYTAGDGVDRTAIAEKLEENYYPNDSKTASRKAGEIARFYKTDENTIFVAMAGEKLIAFVDDIGSYFYDGNSDMSHLKSGQWHLNFADGETLPTKSEGKLTSCYPLTDEENLMFLYKKYYYQDEEMQLEEISYDDEDPEERNKRLFKYWMSMQVKPEGDSNAGEPYSTDSINSYVSNIQNTPLPMVAERSVFYTTEIAQVQTTIEVLDNSEKKNNTQRSAIKKYLQYLIATKEDYMPLIFNTDIETKYERNRIVFGAPGTGKSYGLKDDCEKLMADTAGTYERVTFHPDYSYSQFVGTYKPVMDADGRSIRYDFVPGPFMRVYVDALKSGRTDAPQPHLLLIEEINRAKVAAVFGDVFQLLDRDDDGVSEYEIQASEDIRRYLAAELGGTADNYKKIRIPNNMFIWATMNSADQGVFPMDTAFKRRWNFEYLGINENEEKIQGIGKIMLPGSDEPIEWNMLRKAINDKMSSSDFKINEDKLMGPFFLSKKVIASNENGMIIDTERFIDAFKSKVIMYLYEDAVKQGKHRFFDGCDSSKYSSVCEAFDTMGTAIFGATFRETFYDKQRNDA